MRRTWHALRVGIVALLVLGILTGCASATTTDASESTGADTTDATTTEGSASTAEECNIREPTGPLPDPAEVTGSIRVLAAASLAGVFDDMARAFEHAHPRAKVQPSYGASPDLVAQIQQGAPADVIATADAYTMNLAVDTDDVQTPVTFTCNHPTILTAKSNPLDITGLDDLARSDVRFVLCAAPVPCGLLGRQVLDRAGVDAQPVGSEANVKAVVAKVARGEVDAGIVYVTDAEAASDATDSVMIPASRNVTTTYPIAVASDADNPTTARAFVDFVTSPEGQRILDGYGFGTP